MSETKIVASRLDPAGTFVLTANDFGDGSAGAPSLSFASQTTLGLYKPASNTLGISTNGSLISKFDTIGLTMTSTGGSGLRVYGAAGTHQWDIYLNSTNLRFSDNTTGGSVQFDTSILSADGSAAAPAYSFTSQPNMGIYRAASSDIGFAAGGALVLEVAASKIIASQPVLISDGSAAVPSLALGSNQTTGIYKFSTNQIGFSCNSAPTLSIQPGVISVQAGVQLQNVDGTAAAPSYSFGNNSGMGLYRVGSNSMGFATAGTAQWEIDSSGSLFPAASQRLFMSNGTIGVPALSPTSETTTGIYHPASNQIGIAGTGTQVALFDGTPGNAMLTLNQARTGAVQALSLNNLSAGNTGNHVVMGMGVADGTAGDTVIIMAIGGPTTYWAMGVDNDVNDQFCISVTPGLGTAFPGTGDVLEITTNGQIKVSSGSASSPTYTFSTLTNTGMYYLGNTSGEMGFSSSGSVAYRFHPNVHSWYIGGVEKINIDNSGNHIPVTDNAISSGKSGNRWSTVWAANGTVQTSHSSTKTDIVNLASDIEVPRGITFRRPGEDRIHVGFLADDLPKEAFYDEVNVETSSVIGVLCAAVRSLKEEVKALKAKLGA